MSKSKKAGSSKHAPIDYGVLNSSLGYLIRRAQLRIFQEFNHFFEALDIKPAQFSTLEIIHSNPGLRQSSLAKALNIQRTNMVGMLDKLQQRGLIERKPSANDLRAHALHLTIKGEKLLDHLHQQFHQHEDLIFQRLGEEKYQQVRDALLLITEAEKLKN
jgi:DNA-binding MarR family transcriptional regulator